MTVMDIIYAPGDVHLSYLLNYLSFLLQVSIEFSEGPPTKDKCVCPDT